jgi:hypothetical protein
VAAHLAVGVLLNRSGSAGGSVSLRVQRPVVMVSAKLGGSRLGPAFDHEVRVGVAVKAGFVVYGENSSALTFAAQAALSARAFLPR